MLRGQDANALRGEETKMLRGEEAKTRRDEGPKGRRRVLAALGVGCVIGVTRGFCGIVGLQIHF